MPANQNTRLERLFLLGRLLSPFYSCLMANRSRFYRNGFFRQHKLDAPVISVGNLVLGGTGKTPLVIHIARLLSRHGRKPVILSRGYKGTAKANINIVSDAKEILLDAIKAGDEPRLLAEKLPGIPVLTGRKRTVTGRYAITFLAADALILDDGFQHLALKRDLDIVLFSGHKLLGNGHVLPGGELREPLSSLKRADIFVLTGVESPNDARAADFSKYLQDSFPGKPVFTGAYHPENLVHSLHRGKYTTLHLSEVRQMAVFGFCGIAQPQSFAKTLRLSGTNLTGFHGFQDHHSYSLDSINFIYHQARQAKAQALITTEKDFVKLQNLYNEDLPLLVLPVRIKMTPDFDDYLLNRLNISP